MRWRRSAFAFLVIAVTVGGCHRGIVPDTARGDPLADAASPRAAILFDASTDGSGVAAGARRTQPAPPDPRLDLTAAKAWSDPAAVAALAIECAVLPPPGPHEDLRYTPTALECHVSWVQSCSFDPCQGEEDDCRQTCTSECQSCDTRCVDACGACKSRCEPGNRGDACRSDCAQSTGTCRQRCLTTRDTCTSAGCAKQRKGCPAEEDRRWKKNGCKCATMKPCWDTCFEKNGEGDCFDTCRQRFPGCNYGYCSEGLRR